MVPTYEKISIFLFIITLLLWLEQKAYKMYRLVTL